MKTIHTYIALLFLLPVIASCTKVIDLNLGNNTGQLVIEGNITNVNGPQIVKLSNNVPFSNTNTYPAVTGAKVTVSDQAGNSYQFIENPAGTYTAPLLSGVAGTKYTLAVLTNGQTYTASSVMPAVVALDSVTAENNDFNNANNRKKITVHYQDPAGLANQYRFVMYVNKVQVNAVFAANDDFTDGNNVSFDLRENDIDVYPGDTVTVEMQCIDKTIYTYWFTLMQQGQNADGGGVTPSNPPNNITPAAYGYFSAHTTQTKTITVK